MSFPSPDSRPPTSERDTEVLVRVEGVSKIFCRDLIKSLWYGLKDSAHDLLSWGKRTEVRGQKSEARGQRSGPSGSSSSFPTSDLRPPTSEPSRTDDRGQKNPEGSEGFWTGAHATCPEGVSEQAGERINSDPSDTSSLTSVLCPLTSGLRPGEFYAVRDVSFQLRRGECLGLIGSNGAGKTTLLKMLNGLIKPDAGRIEMRRRTGAPDLLQLKKSKEVSIH